MISDSSAINETILEGSLKDLLQNILTQLEQYIDTQDDLKEVQGFLRDYESLQQLVETTQAIFNILMNKIQQDTKQRFFKSDQKPNYDKLEKLIQKYEQEIRDHIRIEHELKLYAEQLTQQLEESEAVRTDFLRETTKLINGLKKENQQYVYQINSFTKQQLMTQTNTNAPNSASAANKTFTKKNDNTSYNKLTSIIQQQQIKIKQTKEHPTSQNSLLNKEQSIQQITIQQQQGRLTGKDSQKSISGRQCNKTARNMRNKSYSLGVSKQSSASSSFAHNKYESSQQLNKLLTLRKKSFHTDNRYRVSVEQLKQLYK